MSYIKKTWVTGEIIQERDLNNIENGIYNLDQEVNSPEGSIAEKIDNIVQISDTQPQSDFNKIWVKGDNSGVQIPTYNEFEDLMYNIAEEYSNSNTYDIGDYVIYENLLYRCIIPITVAETWTPEHWSITTVVEELGASKVIAEPYSESNLYEIGDYVTYNNKLYKCNTAITMAETWTAAHWTEVTIGEKFKDFETNGIFVEDITPTSQTWGTYFTKFGGMSSTSNNFSAYKINVENIDALIVTYSTYGAEKPYWSFFPFNDSNTRTDYSWSIHVKNFSNFYTNEHLIVNEYIPVPKIAKGFVIVNSKQATTSASFKVLKVNYNNCALNNRLDICNTTKEYSPNSTYLKGEYTSLGGRLYKCACDIITPEQWNRDHWYNVYLSTEMSLLNSTLGDFLPKPIIDYTYLTDGGSINIQSTSSNYGAVVSSDAYSCTLDYIDISNYSELIYPRILTSSSVSSNYGMCFYNNEKVVISHEAALNNFPEPDVAWNYITIPENAVYARFTYANSTNKRYYTIPFAVYDATEYKKALLTQLKLKNNNNFVPKSLVDETFLADHRAVNATTGASIVSSNADPYSTTYYIKIAGIQKLTYPRLVITSTTSSLGIAFYDNTQTYISGSGEVCKYNSPIDDVEFTTIDVPANAVYVRFTYWSSTNVNGLYYKYPFAVYDTSEYIKSVKYIADSIIQYTEIGNIITENTTDVAELKSAVEVLEPTATSSDVGKALIAKTVNGGKVTEYKFGSAGAGLTAEIKSALLACFAHVAWAGDDGQDYYDALDAALNRP